MTLNADTEAREEEEIRQQVRQLSDPLRAEFHRQFKRRYRDPDTYATLNYLLLAGLHHFYLGRWIRGSINLSLFLIGILLLFSPLLFLGIVLMIGVTVIELYALFHSQLIVQRENNRIMRRILQELQTSPSPPPPAPTNL